MFSEGQTIASDYEILSELSEKDNREVYLAHSKKLQKNVIVKKVMDTLDSSVNIDKEIENIKQINHVCLPRVYDFIRVGGTLYIVLEYITGKSFNEIICLRKTVNENRIIKWLSQIASALDYLGKLKIPVIHTDIKPKNIVIDEEDNLCLLGCNFTFNGDDTEQIMDITLPYASPEQYRKASLFYEGRSHKKITLDARTDVYSTAAVLYQVMTKNLPANPDVEGTPVRDWQLPYSEELIHVIDRAMMKNPSDRYRNTMEMLNDLDKYKKKTDNAGKTARNKTVGILAGLAVGVIVAAVIACMKVDDGNTRSKYKACIRQAEQAVGENDYETAWNRYRKAIEIDPGRGNAYLGMLRNVVLDDGIFDPYENAKLMQVMNDDNLAKLRRKNESKYSRYLYELGNAYYFLYSNEVIGRRFASRYFEQIRESQSLEERERKRADALYRISGYSEQLKLAGSDKGDKIDFNNFWSNLKEIVGTEYDLNTDRMMAAKVYEVFYQYAWLYKNDFLAAGVSYAEMINGLEDAREHIQVIRELENEAKLLPASVDLENDMANLDYNIDQLGKIMDSVKIVEHIDRDTLYFSYELGSYVRSVLDYDDEHSIDQIVSDIEILIKDRYKVTEYQVIVFNGLDEQRILKEGEDYSFELTDDRAYISDDGADGFQYTVRIHPSVFREEGTYRMVIAAKDSLADKMYGDEAAMITNEEVVEENIVLKANKICFTVDNSAPEITLSGVVHGKRYTSKRAINIGYADLCDISKIEIEVADGANVIRHESYTKDDLEEGSYKSGSIPYTINEYKNYQNIKVIASDVSGNKNTYEISILVTSSRLNNWMNNRPVVVGLVVGAVVLLIALVMIARRLTKR